MKKEVIKTENSKLVLQVYHNYYIYNKDSKSYSSRKEHTKWKAQVNSKSAFFENGKLILKKSDYSTQLHNSSVIILNDFNSNSELEAYNLQSKRWKKDLINLKEKADNQLWFSLKQVQSFNTLEIRQRFEVFQLSKIKDSVELHLFYDYFEIGEPKRHNFKLCELKIGVPVEIKINGKLDHSLSGRRGRTFKEHCYIFHLLGKTDTFELKREPYKEKIKQIPKPEKTINLMKELY